MRSRPRIILGAGALVHRRGRLLLVKRNERPSKGTWSFPGGAVEFGETVVDAAVREVKEETGLDVEVEELFDVVTYLPSERGPTARNQIIVVDYLARPRNLRVRLNHESSDFGWFTPRQVRSLKTTGQLKALVERFDRMGIL